MPEPGIRTRIGLPARVVFSVDSPMRYQPVPPGLSQKLLGHLDVFHSKIFPKGFRLAINPIIR